VDFFKGEQQKNMDFAFLQALKTTGVDVDQGVMLIYDIACQYTIYLQRRIGKDLPKGLDIDRAIGQFHIHGHGDKCFFRYSSSFIPGAGIVSGEILESLWSTLNSISPTVRTATLAHRAEVLDDHACDSNHKKALGMPKYLSQRYTQASETLTEAREAFHRWSQTVGPDAVRSWTADIRRVETDRLKTPKVMDIYGMNAAEPDVITAGAAVAEEASPIDLWLEFAMRVEEKQSVPISLQECHIDYPGHRLKIQHHARRKVPDAHKIQQLRDTLLPLFAELNRLQGLAGAFEAGQQPVGHHTEFQEWDDEENMDDLLDDADPPAEQVVDGPMEPLPGGADNPNPPELLTISFPSNGNMGATHLGAELRLRKAQAHTQLTQIRELIAEQSFRFEDEIRDGPRRDVITRGRSTVKELGRDIAYHTQVYGRCRARLVDLGADAATLRQFQVLTKEHTKTSTAILSPNTPGSSTVKLSWIWTAVTGRLLPDVLPADAATDHQTMLECMSSLFLH
jgi:hypothetical protein